MRRKRATASNFLPLLLCVAMVLDMSGCGRVASSPARPSTEAPLGSDIASQKEVDVDDVLLEEPAPLIIPSLGKAMFKDGGEMATLDYQPNLGGSLSMEAEDGTIWTLSIAPNALVSAETITMRLLEDVRLPGLEGIRAAGVALEPDGLYFTSSAYLSIQGPMAQEKTCLFQANADGGELQFGHFFMSEGIPTLRVDHFSTTFAAEPQSDMDIDTLADMAEAEVKRAEREVRAFLKTPIAVPPPPTDMEVSCTGNNYRLIGAYLRQVTEPERTYIKKLVGAGREAILLGRDSDSLYLAQQLSKRLIKKADKLIRTYRNDNKKLIPVMNVTVSILKEADMLGDGVPFSEYTGTFADWTLDAADEILDEIRTEHQYTKLCRLLSLLRGNAILDSGYRLGGNLFDTYSEKISKALRFKLTIETTVTGVDTDGTRSTWKTEASVPMWFDLVTLSQKGLFLMGEGTTSYTDYSSSDSGMKLLKTTEPMKAQARMTGDIKTEAGVFPLVLQVDKLNPNTLTYQDSDGDQYSISSTSMLYKSLFVEAYNSGYIESKFELRNGESELSVDLRAQEDKTEGTVVMTLTHLP